MATTEYLVLVKTEGGWQPVAEMEAAGARAAIQAALAGAVSIEGKDPAISGGEFVAVPARSWKPQHAAMQAVVKFS